MSSALERLRESERALNAERLRMNEALARLGETEKRMETRRTGRLVFGLDLTGSREPGLKQARLATAAMFDAIRNFGSIEVKLVYYRGTKECRESPWCADAEVLRRSMLKLSCERGGTQIAKLLRLAGAQSENLPPPSSSVTNAKRTTMSFGASRGGSGKSRFPFSCSTSATTATATR